jgi:putative FmdB family regulatory protein
MPIYEFSCQACNTVTERITSFEEKIVTCHCGGKATRIPSRCSVIISGNMGPKLRTRVALDDELKKQGISAPLFSSDSAKDKARWILKKEGIR